MKYTEKQLGWPQRTQREYISPARYGDPITVDPRHTYRIMWRGNPSRTLWWDHAKSWAMYVLCIVCFALIGAMLAY